MSAKMHNAIKAFLDLNPSIITNHRLCSSLFRCAVILEDIDTLKIFIDHGLDIDIKDSILTDKTPLATAATLGKIKSMRWLIDHGATVNYYDKDGSPRCPALSVLLFHSDFEAAKVLVDAGAALNAIDFRGCTALNYSVGPGHEEMDAYLRSKGALFPREIPGWKPPPPVPRMIARMEEYYGPVHDKSWNVQIGDATVDIRTCWNGDKRYGAIFSHGLANYELAVPDDKKGYRSIELVIVLQDWPADPEEWDSPEWIWPVQAIQNFAKHVLEKRQWLGLDPVVVTDGKPLGPNTQLSAWFIRSGRDPHFPIYKSQHNDDDCIRLYPMIALYQEEVPLLFDGRLEVVYDKLERASLDETLKRDRKCFV